MATTASQQQVADRHMQASEVERLPATRPLLRDLHVWRLTRKLQRIFVHMGNGQMQRTRAKDQQDAKNILDRWLLSFQLDHRGRMSDSMPLFPREPMRLADGASQKLVDECLEKRFSADRRNAERVTQALIDAVTELAPAIEARIEQQDATVDVSFWERRIVSPAGTGAASIRAMEGQLRIGHYYESPVCPRIYFLVRNFGLYNTARMMLRYESLGTGSLQWGDPVTVHHALYDLMGVRYEGFASPLNSKLLGKPGAAFCSLFRDTDAPFGSLGEFFSVDFVDHPGGWSVNPPFIEELMGRVTDKVLQHLDRETGHNWFFVTYPTWQDCPGWQKLAQSRHKSHQLDLDPRRFTVQDCYGGVFCPNNTLTVFVLGQLPSCFAANYEAVRREFFSVNVAAVESVWKQHCSTVNKG